MSHSDMDLVLLVQRVRYKAVIDFLIFLPLEVASYLKIGIYKY
jgi:hypothetical protein